MSSPCLEQTKWHLLWHFMALRGHSGHIALSCHLSCYLLRCMLEQQNVVVLCSMLAGNIAAFAVLLVVIATSVVTHGVLADNAAML